jgi:glycosyltransferase involved in cell wall biosynthesis
MNKLSIVIPMFNVEAYVPRAANSIASQAFDKLEVVVVDDGSTDKSLDACLASLKGVNVKAIRQENRGPGGARNTGILESTGDYILFLDSDDALIPGALKSIVSILDSEEPDVLFGNYHRYRTKGIIRGQDYSFLPPGEPKKRTEYIVSKLPTRSWNVWRYICRRRLILDKEILFESGMYCEDIKWTLEVLESAKKISFLQQPFYLYSDRRPGSIMNTRSVKKMVDLNSVVDELTDVYFDRPVLYRELIQEAFFSINEYFQFKGIDKRIIFESYKLLLPKFMSSYSFTHRVASFCGNRALLFCLSFALYTLRKVRRLLLRQKLETGIDEKEMVNDVELSIN